ncbi:DUF6142 family protein [Lachnoclostridium phytofermentans]|uniref:Uncharacterized protein n=1 Tax=Lachnoclostridium phytofermentans (strain ATCC 700394 / DSM 18823 / ISDg) TaxID=357809 RepID=A9KHX7_LACP7|nr:DUF6142 family protein [Lachnoclostridium phytofermentans]ABX43824.1 hypothetical protein Cphy_3473 [Lachnoclostridium phytofermentans ISDg]
MILKKAKYKFKGRVHSKNGILSFLLGIAVIISFFTISIISGINKGQGDIVLGAIGITTFLASVYGFLAGYKSFQEKDIYLVAPILGIGINGIMLISLFCLYILGIVL